MPSPDLNPPPNGMDQEVIDFRTRTVMPDEDVDLIWRERPGYLEAAIKGARADIYARLRKRYLTNLTPFVPAAGRPEIVVRWETRIVTPEAYRARGVNPADDQMAAVEADRTRAYEEIKEAADSKDGLYDLPADPALDASAVATGGPLGYSESSPYTWTDVQAEELGRTGSNGWRR